ncbi:MAG: hypothetical protein CL943_03275 [Candidatus Diapherotrites archaeon]|uniref:CARDB domain-containing protein n=1 Tax=Candidatus Iainarchaeum sp. TaxID=3101447 RepID=A0A2D6M1M9_9ARCH|nr:hypothetical protein [Candidatus Diapherotrites archaeon]
MKKIIMAIAVLLLASMVIAGDLKVDAVNYTPAPAIPGGYIDVFVHLKNDSKYLAEDLYFEIDLSGGTERDSTYPFSLGTGVSETTYLSSINPHKSVLLEYRIRVDPSALDDNYIIVFNYGEGAAKKQYKYNIQVLSRKPNIEIIRSSHVQAAPGQAIDVELRIRNIGSGLAKDVLIGMEEDRTVTTTGVVVEREFSSLGASFDYLGDVAASQEKKANISMAINPDAEQKTYMIPIKVKYKDANGTSFESTTYIGLKVGQEPELDAVVSEISPTAFPGGTSEISVDLFNVGIGTAKYVVAELATETGYLDQEKVFIGTLEADDFDSFKVNLSVKPTINTSEEQTVNVLFKYKNQYGEDKELLKELKLEVLSIGEQQARSGAGDPVSMVIGLIALALQLLGLFVAGKWAYKRFVKKGK